VTLPPPSDPTPDFYPDGEGAMRLWDGQRWTTVTRPMPQPQPQPAPEKEPPKNWFQRNIGWKLAVLLGICVLASCGAIVGGTDSADTTAQPTPAAIEDPSEEPEPEPTQETVEVGEKVRDGGYQFS
jgi:hypothetical protein